MGGQADAIIKEEPGEPDFVETVCGWVGCDRDLHTQEALVKVGFSTLLTWPRILPIYNSFSPQLLRF